MLLNIEHLSKYFDAGKVQALADVSLHTVAGKTYSVLGESGSGKTTLARLIAGLERPDNGTIYLDDTLISSDAMHLAPEKRAVGLVFQNYALFPHLNVAQNIAYGLRNQMTSQREETIRGSLDLVNLQGYQQRFPHELSGGQQQRVALARALALRPKLLLLDEPFSNLNNTLRIALRDELFGILKNLGICSVFITHNADDALAISDEIIVLRDGQLLQQAAPQVLYEHPINRYVAQLFDPLVAMPASLLQDFGFSPSPGQEYYLRAHQFVLAEKPSDYQLKATVMQSNFIGKHHLLEVKIKDHSWKIHGQAHVPGTEVSIGWNEADLLRFPKE